MLRKISKPITFAHTSIEQTMTASGLALAAYAADQIQPMSGPIARTI